MAKHFTTEISLNQLNMRTRKDVAVVLKICLIIYIEPVRPLMMFNNQAA